MGLSSAALCFGSTLHDKMFRSKNCEMSHALKIDGAEALCLYPAARRHGRHAQAPASGRARRCAWKGPGASPPRAAAGADLGGSSKNPTKIRIKFTYIGSDIRTLTKIFKKSTLKVAYIVNNTIKIRCKSGGQCHKYKSSCVYQLKCRSCEQVSIGHTGRDFRTMFKEHTGDIRFNQTESKYAQHIFESNHEYGTIKTHIYKANKNRRILN
jgi:hypothetical protein